MIGYKFQVRTLLKVDKTIKLKFILLIDNQKIYKLKVWKQVLKNKIIEKEYKSKKFYNQSLLILRKNSKLINNIPVDNCFS